MFKFCFIFQGIYIKSTYDGLHVITGTTENVSEPLGLLRHSCAIYRLKKISPESLHHYQRSLKHAVNEMLVC